MEDVRQTRPVYDKDKTSRVESETETSGSDATSKDPGKLGGDDSPIQVGVNREIPLGKIESHVESWAKREKARSAAPRSARLRGA